MLADVPSTLLSMTILPRMTVGHVLSAKASGRQYQVPIADFRTVAGQMGECGATAQRTLSGAH